MTKKRAAIGLVVLALVSTLVAWPYLYRRVFVIVELDGYQNEHGRLVCFESQSIITGATVGLSEQYYADTELLHNREWWFGENDWRRTVWDRFGRIEYQERYEPTQWDPVLFKDRGPWLWGERDQPEEGVRISPQQKAQWKRKVLAHSAVLSAQEIKNWKQVALEGLRFREWEQSEQQSVGQPPPAN